MAFRSACNPLNDAPYILAPVDSHLKERLVGAAVLVAAAVILIPEMLSGPAEQDTAVVGAERVVAEGGVKTYTIDLGNRARSGADDSSEPDEPAAGAVVEAAAPPPEASPAADTDKPAAARVASSPPPKPAPVSQPAPADAKVPEPTTPTAAKEVSGPSRPAGVQNLPWAVQVGSFASQATAERLSQDLQRRGYPSFVVPFKPGAQTLYRVRVGPMEDRKAADATVQKLKREGTGATVVANS